MNAGRSKNLDMTFDVVLPQILTHSIFKTEGQKKMFLFKLIQNLSTNKDNGNKDLTYDEMVCNFDSCLNSAVENSFLSSVSLSLYAFSVWGSKYSDYLKEYLTIDKINSTFSDNDPVKLTIKLMWLRECINLLCKDEDFSASIRPILSNILETKLVEHGNHSVFLAQLAELYLQCPSLLPSHHLRENFTITIMHSVASFSTPTKTETLKHMNVIGELITMLWESMPLESILETLISMYSIISNTDPTVEVCPAMAHILSLVFPQVVEGLGPRIVSDPQSSSSSFIATLNRLCLWLVAWPTAHKTLVHWTQTLCKLLYHNNKNIIPSKITYEQVPKLLDALRIPVCRPGVCSVVTFLLMSFKYSPIVFHKIIPQLVKIIESLEKEPTDSASTTLTSVVLLCHAQMTMFLGYPEIYQPLMDVLNKHDTPDEEEIRVLIQDYHWVTNNVSMKTELTSSKCFNKMLGTFGTDTFAKYYKRSPELRVGLRNLGNTCYMNSVIQALFMTDDFRQAVLHTNPESNERLLVKLQHLFTHLCFSDRFHVSPVTFHDKSRPSWFSPGMQQDCSEYLRHMMITLHEEEKSGQSLPEYQERMIIESETASLASDVQLLPDEIPDEMDYDSKLESIVTDLGSPINESSPSYTVSSTDLQELKEPSSTCKKLMYAGSPSKVGLDISPKASIVPGISSFKRKHNVSPLSTQSQCSKSPKGDNSPDNDNSSDSGISGDLAEELDFVPLSSTPLKRSSSVDESKPVQTEEATCDNDFFVSQVQKNFGGKIATSIKCLNCKTESIHKDVFTDINLTFKDSDQFNAASAMRKQPERLCKQKQGENPVGLRIEDMVANYLAPERLTGENQYECEKCSSKQDAERSIEILESPQHLILIQLRFYYDTLRGQRQKVFTNVDFSEDLDLPTKNVLPEDPSSLNKNESPDGENLKEEDESFIPSQYVSPETHQKYSLYAVVVHSGFSSEGGHYYCYARNSSIAVASRDSDKKEAELNSWYNFNDEKVTKTTFTNISCLTRTFSRDTAYVLFYKKVEQTDASLPEDPILEDLSRLRPDLQESLLADNKLYRSEQETEFVRRKCHQGATVSGIHSFRKDDNDEDRPPPSGSCGGGSSFDMASREVF